MKINRDIHLDIEPIITIPEEQSLIISSNPLSDYDLKIKNESQSLIFIDIVNMSPEKRLSIISKSGVKPVGNDLIVNLDVYPIEIHLMDYSFMYQRRIQQELYPITIYEGATCYFVSQGKRYECIGDLLG
ncbi:MAG: hypothetical protein IBX55_01255 [Methyloprofundus sp.]|nr:hypothetical protein [Methyloprofundus sp.]